ncbi:MAG: hypothetical protein M0Z66_11990 [Thermaerobacter sp.]|nr:hypothetical protein [Thermaerobacter sp.]
MRCDVWQAVWAAAREVLVRKADSFVAREDDVILFSLGEERFETHRLPGEMQLVARWRRVLRGTAGHRGTLVRNRDPRVPGAQVEKQRPEICTRHREVDVVYALRSAARSSAQSPATNHGGSYPDIQPSTGASCAKLSANMA